MSETSLATTNGLEMGAIERVIALGDLSKLTGEQRARYYAEVCASLKLNPLTRPFEYLNLQGKLVLYARKDATDQLRNLRRISLEIVSRETVGDLYVVTARARTPDGRTDEEIGAVSIAGLRGDNLANAFMKASTKSKRRVTLSICGLGMLDESELETVRDAVPFESDRAVRREFILDEEGGTAALPGSTSGAAERLQAEIDSLAEELEPIVAARLLDAETVPTSPAYRRAVAVVDACRKAGVQNVPDVPRHFDDQQWTDMAITWERALRSRKPAR